MPYFPMINPCMINPCMCEASNREPTVMEHLPIYSIVRWDREGHSGPERRRCCIVEEVAFGHDDCNITSGMSCGAVGRNGISLGRGLCYITPDKYCLNSIAMDSAAGCIG